MKAGSTRLEITPKASDVDSRGVRSLRGRGHFILGITVTVMLRGLACSL